MGAKEGLSNAKVPVLGFVAPGGTGKTTLLRAVIALLEDRSLRIGVAKQARDDFDFDQPGKDSYRLRKAGVERLLFASSRKSALILEHPDGGGPELNELLPLFDQDELDIILVEGFSEQPFPKIELIRGNKGPRHYPNDAWVIALAMDRTEAGQASVPVLDINDPAAVAEFVLAWMGGSSRHSL
ncbi:MAG: molybdopterin-guanine dinucleotide biosynthesis protein B [Candidatus Competibacteraceae bacterium]